MPARTERHVRAGIVFEIPILKMQVRFLPGLPIKQTLKQPTPRAICRRFASGSLYCPKATDVRRSALGKPDFICPPQYLSLRMDPDTFLMPLPYCVYILFSRKDFLLYIGYTTNIGGRIENHNGGKTKSTAPRRPLELIFCEFYLFETDARRRNVL